MTVDVDVIMKLVEFLLLPFAWYVIKRLDALSETIKTISKDTGDLKTILIGVDGKNGIRSRVIRLERRVETLSLQQATRHGENNIIAQEDDEDV